MMSRTRLTKNICFLLKVVDIVYLADNTNCRLRTFRDLGRTVNFPSRGHKYIRVFVLFVGTINFHVFGNLFGTRWQTRCRNHHSGPFVFGKTQLCVSTVYTHSHISVFHSCTSTRTDVRRSELLWNLMRVVQCERDRRLYSVRLRSMGMIRATSCENAKREFTSSDSIIVHTVTHRLLCK